MTHVTRYAGTARERLIQATAATSDANGMATFRVGPCPLGYVWQGSVTITNAPSGALFNASVASTPWGQWAGPTNFGPVQLWGNETLVVVAVGLQKLTQYSMLFVGVSLPEDLAEPLPPVAPMSVVEVETATVLVAAALFTPNATSLVITPPTLTRRLTLVIDATNLTTDTCELDVLGNVTNAAYFAELIKSGASQNFPKHATLEPAVDPTYTISTSGGTGGTFRLWVLASTTNPMVDNIAADPLAIEGASVANPVPIRTTGSPVGVFNLAFSADLAIGNNQTLIAAPALGQSIYLQHVAISADAAATAGSYAEFHPTALGNIASLVIPAAAGFSQQYVFPGGYEVGNNKALQANVFVGALRVSGTYVIGPLL